MLIAGLRYWVNSIPKENCAIVNGVDDISPQCVLDIVDHVFGVQDETITGTVPSTKTG